MWMIPMRGGAAGAEANTDPVLVKVKWNIHTSAETKTKRRRMREIEKEQKVCGEKTLLQSKELSSFPVNSQWLWVFLLWGNCTWLNLWAGPTDSAILGCYWFLWPVVWLPKYSATLDCFISSRVESYKLFQNMFQSYFNRNPKSLKPINYIWGISSMSKPTIEHKPHEYMSYRTNFYDLTFFISGSNFCYSAVT